jgi:hypothetical membrane protein
MTSDNAKLAGILLLIGSIQFTILLVIAESIYPGYSTSTNFISDLGVWGKPSALLFNPSIALLGALNLVSSYFIKKQFNLGKVAYLFALASTGTLAVGFFPENTVLVGGFALIHGIGAFLAFLMSAAAAIAAYTYTKSPFRFISIVLGIVSFVSFVLFLTTAPYGSLGIGIGGMERMIVYPTLLWTISFGGYLLGLSK